MKTIQHEDYKFVQIPKTKPAKFFKYNFHIPKRKWRGVTSPVGRASAAPRPEAGSCGIAVHNLELDGGKHWIKYSLSFLFYVWDSKR